ncbi:MAG: hypothetical protein EOS07_03100 [Mesorhizobium sp.]|uniref:hypothetical protein n=1 Tax=Mesorhizobium sp. TaxID=1871066 RepID=UPI000FE551BE|nr:hypothetical protein [Mesorhizobium sp.]RWB07658.1 MAG: hypothetical protein EOQ33_02770 [Mesorhizobium sp.]RWB97732.1 MAG: hypothetical protein EOQ56_21800 [Mesorhizobium sp.]RWO13664.1 MAG: hypothetical protein EOS07_03100 [Mesorhizobium sp.]RWO14195.1 MAG: hypothetical protein EOS08_29780 [Mesorhizobium sp.]RWP05332.1 MAG: hypothetical protein EOQ99_15185 [Mesorhizobium sp.]
MVEIISKRDGPRREDAQVKRLIEQNRSTIVRLADQISGGGYSASRKPRQQPKAEGLIIHVGGGAVPVAEGKPSIQVTMNGRVISKDRNTGRQLHHIGDIRDRGGDQVFVLATKQNGFFSPVDEIVAEALADMDGSRLAATYTEGQLAFDIGAKLGIN